MQNEILDDFEALDATPKKEKFEWKNSFPIFLMWVGVFGNRYNILGGDLSSIVAVVALIAGTVWCYYDWKRGVWFLSAMLVLSAFGFLHFFDSGFYFGDAPINFIPLILGLILFFQNTTLMSEEKKEAAKQAEVAAMIKRYKYGFRDKSVAELKEKLNNENISKPAKMAAQELLNEKTQANEG